jgi:hypothetical protein
MARWSVRGGFICEIACDNENLLVATKKNGLTEPAQRAPGEPRPEVEPFPSHPNEQRCYRRERDR